jgi:hypothetical protein
MSVWPGHLATTRIVMLAVLERAAAGANDFSVDECALVTACEFRAAVVGRVLSAHLRLNAKERLCTLSILYGAIGAQRFAQLLHEAHVDLGHLSTVGKRRRIKLLEQDLHKTVDPVDHLLARFAETVNPRSASYARSLHCLVERLRVVVATHPSPQ